MNQPQSTTKITVACPSGHRLSGTADLVGKTVKCPKCSTEFVFAPGDSSESPQPPVSDTRVMRILGDYPHSPAPEPTPAPESKQVTDTRVMRILGDYPRPSAPEPQPKPEPENKGVSDTGVMRILGDASQLPPPPASRQETPMRPCPRCEVAIPQTAAVCEHCNTYVGVMPRFMKQMTDDIDAHRN